MVSRLTLTHLVALIVVAATASTAPATTAPQSPPLIFAAEKLDTTCAELATRSGKKITIVNATATEKDLNVILSSSDPDTTVTAACEGLDFLRKPTTVPAGDSVTVALKATSKSEPDKPVKGAVVV